CDPRQADAWADPGDTANLGAVDGGIPRRIRQVRTRDAVAQTDSKTLPTHRCWGRIPPRSKTGDRLRRRLDSDRRARAGSARGAAAIPSNGKGRWPRSRVALLQRLRGTPRFRGAKTLPSRRRRSGGLDASDQAPRRDFAHAG